MRQAITTKFIGPTNTRGSRVKATAAAGSITLHWDAALNPDRNHMAAAKTLAEKFNWQGRYVMGGHYNGDCVFVCDDGAPLDSFTVVRKERVVA